MGSSVVAASNRSEALLSSRVPNLHLDGRTVQFQRLDLKIHANCANVTEDQLETRSKKKDMFLTCRWTCRQQNAATSSSCQFLSHQSEESWPANRICRLSKRSKKAQASTTHTHTHANIIEDGSLSPSRSSPPWQRRKHKRSKKTRLLVFQRKKKKKKKRKKKKKKKNKKKKKKEREKVPKKTSQYTPRFFPLTLPHQPFFENTEIATNYSNFKCCYFSFGTREGECGVCERWDADWAVLAARCRGRLALPDPSKSTSTPRWTKHSPSSSSTSSSAPSTISDIRVREEKRKKKEKKRSGFLFSLTKKKTQKRQLEVQSRRAVSVSALFHQQSRRSVQKVQLLSREQTVRAWGKKEKFFFFVFFFFFLIFAVGRELLCWALEFACGGCMGLCDLLWNWRWDFPLECGWQL